MDRDQLTRELLVVRRGNFPNHQARCERSRSSVVISSNKNIPGEEWKLRLECPSRFLPSMNVGGKKVGRSRLDQEAGEGLLRSRPGLEDPPASLHRFAGREQIVGVYHRLGDEY